MTVGGRLVLPQDDSYVRHTLVKLLKPFFHVLLEREPQKFMCLLGRPSPQMFRENAALQGGRALISSSTKGATLCGVADGMTASAVRRCRSGGVLI